MVLLLWLISVNHNLSSLWHWWFCFGRFLINSFQKISECWEKRLCKFKKGEHSLRLLSIFLYLLGFAIFRSHFAAAVYQNSWWGISEPPGFFFLDWWLIIKWRMCFFFCTPLFFYTTSFRFLSSVIRNPPFFFSPIYPCLYFQPRQKGFVLSMSDLSGLEICLN